MSAIPTGDAIRDAVNLSAALSTAVQARFMAPEHGASIWKNFIKETNIDVPKIIKKDAKKGVERSKDASQKN